MRQRMRTFIVKRKQITCRCDAESYPHRLGSTEKCREHQDEINSSEQLLVSYTNDYFARMDEYGLKESDFY